MTPRGLRIARWTGRTGRPRRQATDHGGIGRHTLAADDDTVAICNALLVRAGLPKLTVVMADGLPDMEATFNVEGDGVNADHLDALDRAEWRLKAFL